MANDNEIVTLSSAELSDDGGLPTVVATVALTDEVDDVEHFGDVPVMGALGVTALPAPVNDNGHAEGVLLRRVGNFDAVVTGARDERAADVVGQLAPGETVLHATGEGFDARVFCKDGSVSIVVGDGTVWTLSASGNKMSVAGHFIEYSEENGIAIAEKGGAGLFMKDGIVILKGKTVFIGENAVSPIHHGAGLGPTSIPSASVLVPIA